MHSHTFGAFALENGHLQGITHQVSGHALAHCPANHLA
jgi:hypothetical protein